MERGKGGRGGRGRNRQRYGRNKQQKQHETQRKNIKEQRREWWRDDDDDDDKHLNKNKDERGGHCHDSQRKEWWRESPPSTPTPTKDAIEQPAAHDKVMVSTHENVAHIGCSKDKIPQPHLLLASQRIEENSSIPDAEKVALLEKEAEKEAVEVCAWYKRNPNKLIAGCCEAMCPTLEFLRRRHLGIRNTRGGIWIFECTPEGTFSKDLAVKDLRRQTSSQHREVPSELRTPSTLLRTARHLGHHVMARVPLTSKEVSVLPKAFRDTWYSFLCDRMRAMRMDIATQDAHTIDTLQVLMVCTRFRCVARYVMADVWVDQTRNSARLLGCFHALSQHFRHLRPTYNGRAPSQEAHYGNGNGTSIRDHIDNSDDNSNNEHDDKLLVDLEAEALSLHLLYACGDDNGESINAITQRNRGRGLLRHPRVLLALRVVRLIHEMLCGDSKSTLTYTTFFKLFCNLNYNEKCTISPYISKIRVHALRIMSRVCGPYKTHKLEIMLQHLGFIALDDAKHSLSHPMFKALCSVNAENNTLTFLTNQQQQQQQHLVNPADNSNSSSSGSDNHGFNALSLACVNNSVGDFRTVADAVLHAPSSEGIG